MSHLKTAIPCCVGKAISTTLYLACLPTDSFLQYLRISSTIEYCVHRRLQVERDFKISHIEIMVYNETFRKVSTRALGMLFHRFHRFQWNFTSLKGLPQNSNRQNDFWFGYFRGQTDHLPPPVCFFGPRKSPKLGKMYEALNAMVLNRLLWGFAHILLHP